MKTSTWPSASPGDRPGYGGLREAAVRILADAPAPLEESVLARALFGTAAGDRWTALLPAVLGEDERVECVDGRWRLTRSSAGRAERGAANRPLSAANPSGPLNDLTTSSAILTLALATTGADPRRHRIARVAVVRREADQISARLDAVVTSVQRLPRYLRDAARVTTDDLEAAPSFADVAPALRELVDGHPVYIYGASRARAFVDEVFRRADLQGLEARFVELDTLVRSLLPGTRKPGLFAAADELGVQHTGRSSPLAEAELAGRVIERLRERLGSSPGRSVMADSIERSDPGRTMPFTREWLARVPEGPGVYVVEDAEGRVLYVGKAVNLQRRLTAYVGRQPSLHRRLEALGVRAAAVTTIGARSDLEATLLEARLIRERQPTFNVARQTRGPTTIVRAAPDARTPGVRLVNAVAADGARYFGPFESVSAARVALNVARAAYPAAFARRRADVAGQRRAVLDVCRLLSGQKEPALAMLRDAMRQAAASGDQAEVGRLRGALRDVHAVCLRTSPLAGIEPGWQLLVLERHSMSWGRLHLIQDARLVASTDTDTSALPTDPAHLRRFARELFGTTMAGDAETSGDDEEIEVQASWSPDESAILLRWLAQARSRLEIERLPKGDGAILP